MQMRRQRETALGSGPVRNVTVRLTDDLHAKARRAAGAESLNAFIREAVAEKVGRSDLIERVTQLEARIERLERQQRSRS